MSEPRLRRSAGAGVCSFKWPPEWPPRLRVGPSQGTARLDSSCVAGRACSPRRTSGNPAGRAARRRATSRRSVGRIRGEALLARSHRHEACLPGSRGVRKGGAESVGGPRLGELEPAFRPLLGRLWPGHRAKPEGAGALGWVGAIGAEGRPIRARVGVLLRCHADSSVPQRDRDGHRWKGHDRRGREENEEGEDLQRLGRIERDPRGLTLQDPRLRPTRSGQIFLLGHGTLPRQGEPSPSGAR